MIYYILGVITGILLSLVMVVYRPVIYRTSKQFESKMMRKGSILEPENDELSNWVEGLPTE